MIAIIGPKGSGKTTVSDYIELHYKYKSLAFADPIKDIAMRQFGINRATLYSTDPYSRMAKESIDERLSSIIGTSTSPRILMQAIGDKLREINPNIFVNLLMAKYNGTPAVISDMRFFNEYKRVKDLYPNLIVIHIKRNMYSKPDLHLSETDYINIPANYILDNNGSIIDLFKQVDALFNNIR